MICCYISVLNVTAADHNPNYITSFNILRDISIPSSSDLSVVSMYHSFELLTGFVPVGDQLYMHLRNDIKYTVCPGCVGYPSTNSFGLACSVAL